MIYTLDEDDHLTMSRLYDLKEERKRLAERSRADDEQLRNREEQRSYAWEIATKILAQWERVRED